MISYFTTLRDYSTLRTIMNNKKKFKKNGIVCKDITTEKAQEQDWDGTVATKLN